MSNDYRLFWIIAYISTASALVPFLFGVKKFNNRIQGLKVVSLFCLLCFCFDVASLLSKRYVNEVNNLYRIFEFITLLYVYYTIWKNGKNRIVYISFALAYSLFFIAELSFNSQKQLNSYSITLTSLVFIYFSVRYFYLLMRDLPTDQIQRLPMFWVNTGVLTYFAGGLFLFAMRNYVITVFNDNQTTYWSFHNFLNIVKNLLFAVALWQDLRKPKPI